MQVASGRGRQRGTFATAFAAYLQEQRPTQQLSSSPPSSAREDKRSPQQLSSSPASSACEDKRPMQQLSSSPPSSPREDTEAHTGLAAEAQPQSQPATLLLSTASSSSSMESAGSFAGSAEPFSLSLPPRGELPIATSKGQQNTEPEWSPIADDTLQRLSHALLAFQRTAELSGTIACEESSPLKARLALQDTKPPQLQPSIVSDVPDRLSEVVLHGQSPRGRGVSFANSASRSCSESSASSASSPEWTSEMEADASAHATRWIQGTLWLVHEHALRHNSPRSVQDLERVLRASGVVDLAPAKTHASAVPVAALSRDDRVFIGADAKTGASTARQLKLSFERKSGDAAKLDASDFLFGAPASL